jgi:hypothetical protein
VNRRLHDHLTFALVSTFTLTAIRTCRAPSYTLLVRYSVQLSPDVRPYETLDVRTRPGPCDTHYHHTHTSTHSWPHVAWLHFAVLIDHQALTAFSLLEQKLGRYEFVPKRAMKNTNKLNSSLIHYNLYTTISRILYTVRPWSTAPIEHQATIKRCDYNFSLNNASSDRFALAQCGQCQKWTTEACRFLTILSLAANQLDGIRSPFRHVITRFDRFKLSSLRTICPKKQSDFLAKNSRYFCSLDMLRRRIPSIFSLFAIRFGNNQSQF